MPKSLELVAKPIRALAVGAHNDYSDGRDGHQDKAAAECRALATGGRLNRPIACLKRYRCVCVSAGRESDDERFAILVPPFNANVHFLKDKTYTEAW